ncbi:MAG: tripartite tricarboxylate transporter substrate binding protein [Burkholderiales bacterium]|jgi:tripartite-type tricarboxylate transporter receptor subunit TctC
MRSFCTIVLLALLSSANAYAQAYPSRPIHLVVPFPAGGPTDVIARAIGQKLADAIGQPVVIDNKPGAGGAIGSEAVARSAPDGYTVVIGTSSTHSIGPALNPKTPYKVERDFAPVSLVATAPNVLIVSPKLAANNVRELIALAKAQPGKLNYATSGVGTIVHLSSVLFANMAGIDIVHVPYKGVTQALPDIMSGQIALMFDNIVGVLPRVKAGQEKAIAVTSLKRSPLAPNIPTVAESGLPGYESETYFGIFAPAGTPEAVVTKLSQDLAQVLKRPDLKELLATQGAEAVGSDPAKLAAVVRADTAKWEKVIKAAGVKIE